ncbi:MAG TPA: hypothetical protein VEI97_10385, partial [bacterium]|nr:hypothetical protein [bacterium]
GNKLGTGTAVIRLPIDPLQDEEEFRITRGTFDVLVSRPAVPAPEWKKRYPGLSPNIGTPAPVR